MSNGKSRTAAVLALAAAAGLLGWQIYRQWTPGPQQTVRMQQTLMGTLWSIQVWAPGHDPAQVRQDIAAAFEEVARVEAVMSEWREDSPISLLNRSAGGPGEDVPAELAAIIARGLEYGRLSSGAFDITWKGMGNLWTFGDEFRVPSQEAIEKAISRVNYRLVEIEGRSLSVQSELSGRTAPETRNPDEAAFGDGPLVLATVGVRLPKKGMALGLGGIAKGYGIDRAGKVLRQKGYGDFLVDGGGDVLTSGKRAGRPWRVGIENPRSGRLATSNGSAASSSGALLGYVETTGGAVATSGDYQRFRMVDGVRYHHIIDPRSGRPARGCRSVTVVAPSAEQADALATAIFVLGPEQGLELADSLEDVETLIVDSAGQLHQSTGSTFTPAASPAD